MEENERGVSCGEGRSELGLISTHVEIASIVIIKSQILKGMIGKSLLDCLFILMREMSYYINICPPIEKG